MSALAPPVESSTRTVVVIAVALAAILILTHLATFASMADRWSHDPQYSHGFVVPAFALVVLWSRRDMLKQTAWTPENLGWPIMTIGLMLRVVAAQSDADVLDAAALFPTVFGLVLLVGGWPVMRWSWPALLLLAFMVPLPHFVETALAQPLRRIATDMSTYALQTLGCPALSEGNVILIEDMELGVAEACSGIGMLMTFFALATAMAMIVHAPWHDRAALIASAIPIAVLANVLRITATGVAYDLAGKDGDLGRLIYHDLAGWLMMPLALAILWLEWKFLANLFREQTAAGPLLLASPMRSALAIELPKVIAAGGSIAKPQAAEQGRS
jgi:exosortase